MALLIILVILYSSVNLVFSNSLINSVDRQMLANAELLKRRLRLDEPNRLDLFSVQENSTYARSDESVHYIIWDANKRQPIRRSSNLLRVEPVFPGFELSSPTKFGYQEFAGIEYRSYHEIINSESEARGQQLVLQLLFPLDAVKAEVSRLNTLFYWMTPLPVLLVVIGGWWVAERALRPVRRFIDDLNNVNADKLNTRLQISRNDEIGELAAAFNVLLNRIEITFQSLKRFTADAAHQLRTPLTSIRALSEIALSRDREKQVYRETFSNVLEEVEHLLKLSDSLMQLARADAGIVDIKESSTNISDILNNWIENLLPLAEEKNIQINFEIKENTTLVCYAILVESIIVNLLANAINYTPNGGCIQISLHSSKNGVDLIVCDNGPGIADEFKQHIFERFVRLESTRSMAYGSGLGLAIVKSAVAAHQGSVSVNDSSGGGSCFQVTLPNLKKNSG